MMPSDKPPKDTDISTLCRIHLKAEAYVNTLIAFILALPVLCVIYGYKAIVFVLTNALPFLIWVFNHIVVALMIIIWNVIIAITKGIIYVIKVVIAKLIAAFRWIYRGILYIIAVINWCAVRSIIRMGSLIVGIASIATIVYEVVTIPSGVKLITGFFYDANQSVYLLHIAVLALMLAIGMYYNSWAYSRPEEVEYVCSRTWGLSKAKDMIFRKK